MREEVGDAKRRAVQSEAKVSKLPRCRGRALAFAAKSVCAAIVMTSSSDIP
jgi:hypothetical protein